MADITRVAAAANEIAIKDEDALVLLIGMREKEINRSPALREDPSFIPQYDSTHMGLIDDVKALGWRVANRWNKELYGIVCGSRPADEQSRKSVLEALNLGDAAVIGSVAGALLVVGAPAALAAAVAPLLVKKFILPAKEELCAAWGESIAAQA